MSKTTTKARIIEAAISLFGEHGYDAASLRDICARAGVNNGAVNYHFGDKRGLYRAVLQNLIAKSESLSLEPTSGAPEARLRYLIRRSLIDIFRDRSEGNEKLIFREIAEPTEELLAMIREPLCHIFGDFLEVVTALCPETVEKRQAELVVLSIFGQIDYYRMFNRFIPELIGQEAANELGLDVLANHITEFSLSAISQMHKA